MLILRPCLALILAFQRHWPTKRECDTCDIMSTEAAEEWYIPVRSEIMRGRRLMPRPDQTEIELTEDHEAVCASVIQHSGQHSRESIERC